MKLIMMLPFMSEEELTILTNKILESKTESFQGVSIPMILPFIEDSDLENILNKYLKDRKNIAILLPFLEQELIDDLFLNNHKNEYEISLATLIPFVSDNLIDTEFNRRLVAKEEIIIFLPFISDEMLSKLADDYINGNKDIPVDKLYPFMSPEDIKRIFAYVLSKDEEDNENYDN